MAGVRSVLGTVLTAERFLLLVHGLLALVFVGYTVAILALFVEQANTGHISEGARAILIPGFLTTLCATLITVGVAVRRRTGRRVYLLGVHAIVLALTWSPILLVLVFFEPVVFFGLLGLTMLCPLVAIVVPPPQRVPVNR